MGTELREWITEIWEYCQEHWIAAAAAGAVLLILLVSAILVRSAKSEDSKAAEIPETDRSPESKPESEPEPEPEPETALDVTPAAQGVVESLLKTVEAASGAAGQKVESIELNIEKARLTIRYAGEAGTKEEELDFDQQEEVGNEDVISVPAEEGSLEAEEETASAAEEEKTPPKRFGIENMNTARSGRVYTEEELLNQIRE